MRELTRKMTATVSEFMRLIADPPPTDADERRAKLAQVSSKGPEVAVQFSRDAAAVVVKGIKEYSVHSPPTVVRRAARRLVLTKNAKRTR